ncbi:MAG: mercuric reductase [Pseudomonadota bacterium]
METFDYLILGSGQATGTLLGDLLPRGARVAVVEGNQVGGSCVNYGCTPTKALVASAKVAHQARRSDDFGVSSGPVSVDYEVVKARMDRIRFASRDGLTEWMEGSDQVSLVRGWGRFEGPKTLRVGDRRLTAPTIFINTGTRPRTPTLEGLDIVPWLDSARLLDLEAVPEHLLVLGGGYIGLEFAQVYHRLGAKVTVIASGDQLMPREDADVAEALQQILTEEGIRIHLNARANAVSPITDRGVTLQYREGDRPATAVGSHLLIATGRAPNTDQLELDATGVTVDAHGYIEVDDCLRTQAEGIFALGDVNGHGAFTHTSVNDAEIALDHLFERGDRRLSSRVITYALFTDPPLGRVGLTEKEALSQGHRVLKATRPMRNISRAREMSETDGFVKVLVDADADLILGASILGVHGDEVINMFATLIASRLPCRTFRKTVLVHPTVSELMPWTLDNLSEIESDPPEESRM